MSNRLEPKPVRRRDFLGIAGLFTSGLAILGSLASLAMLPKPRVTPEVSKRFRIGNPQDLPSGTVKVIPGRNVRVVCTDEGVAALSLICTHLGCIVKETEDGFSCPCHGSKFDNEGKVQAGPAPRALPWLAVSQAADGALVVDAGAETDPGVYYRAG